MGWEGVLLTSNILSAKSFKPYRANREAKSRLCVKAGRRGQLYDYEENDRITRIDLCMPKRFSRSARRFSVYRSCQDAVEGAVTDGNSFSTALEAAGRDSFPSPICYRGIMHSNPNPKFVLDAGPSSTFSLVSAQPF